MQRDLSSFPIQSSLLSKLQEAGFTTVQDLAGIRPSELSEELGVSKEDALAILEMVKGADGKKRQEPKTALEMLDTPHLQQAIITFCQKLDEILGGGVPIAKITEICGAPGIGKTQMCLQLAIDVQVPELFGGVGGEAVYIDTEGSFMVDRMVDVAQATLQHCIHIANFENTTEHKKTICDMTLERLLAGVHYIRCHDYVQLLAFVQTLDSFLKKHPKVKLVIIDSIAFPFRHDFEDLALRTRLLNGLAQNLMRIATRHPLAVLLTNQMTTRIGGAGASTGSTTSHLVPALGESWGHASTLRVLLYWQGAQRMALLYKSPNSRERTAAYQITTGGIRDVELCEVSGVEASDDLEGQATKRSRLGS